MKYIAALLTLTFLAYIAYTQFSKKDIEPPHEEPTLSIIERFQDLPEKQREEFSQGLLVAQKLFNQKRIFDALEKIDELDTIFEGHPAALNIRGTCYVEMRDFQKARTIFEKIHKSYPTNTNVLFNLAEVDFVTKEWELSHSRFSKLHTMLPEDKQAMRQLCQFKILLCNIKMDQVEDAIAIRDRVDDKEDSPMYYYSRAALLYHQGDQSGAEKMIENAHYVWRNNNAALAAWQDTLMEVGYIHSFYGVDSSEK